MTGGQMAPTTLLGQKATTAVNGRNLLGTGYPLKMCELIKELDAPRLVTRCTLRTPAGIKQAKAAIIKGFKNQLENKGFSFVEILPVPDDEESKEYKELLAELPAKVFVDKYGVEKA